MVAQNNQKPSYEDGMKSSLVSLFLQIDIFYTMSIVGTLSFPGEDMDVNNDTSHFFEAISEIQPTVFFGPPSAFERIYHHFREMKKHTSGMYGQQIFPMPHFKFDKDM